MSINTLGSSKSYPHRRRSVPINAVPRVIRLVVPSLVSHFLVTQFRSLLPIPLVVSGPPSLVQSSSSFQVRFRFQDRPSYSGSRLLYMCPHEQEPVSDKRTTSGLTRNTGRSAPAVLLRRPCRKRVDPVLGLRSGGRSRNVSYFVQWRKRQVRKIFGPHPVPGTLRSRDFPSEKKEVLYRSLLDSLNSLRYWVLR